MKCRILKTHECEITQGYLNNHPALDIVGKNCTLDFIIAHSSGKIIFKDDGHNNEQGTRSYGNYYIIDHGNGYQTLYAHLRKDLPYNIGDYVKEGQILGYMGDSGNAYGAHLHFEVRHNGKKINPIDFLNVDLPKKELKPLDEIAQDVINGKYGNYPERKELLEKEGYNYQEVQNKVNEIVKGNIDAGLLFLVKRTIRGDFGNGEERKINLGRDYKKIQHQVNMNYKYGTQNNPRLY